MSLLCCLQNRGVSVSEAVNRNAQCYWGEVCIFNVLYQIDVFWGHDEGITTEAVHNALLLSGGYNTLTENSDDIAVIVCPDLLRLGANIIVQKSCFYTL